MDDPEHEALMALRASRGHDPPMYRETERRLISEGAIELKRAGWEIVFLRHGTKVPVEAAWQEREPPSLSEIGPKPVGKHRG